jgi:hypothetical protein
MPYSPRTIERRDGVVWEEIYRSSMDDLSFKATRQAEDSDLFFVEFHESNLYPGRPFLDGIEPGHMKKEDIPELLFNWVRGQIRTREDGKYRYYINMVQYDQFHLEVTGDLPGRTGRNTYRVFESLPLLPFADVTAKYQTIVKGKKVFAGRPEGLYLMVEVTRENDQNHNDGGWSFYLLRTADDGRKWGDSMKNTGLVPPDTSNMLFSRDPETGGFHCPHCGKDLAFSVKHVDVGQYGFSWECSCKNRFTDDDFLLAMGQFSSLEQEKSREPKVLVKNDGPNEGWATLQITQPDEKLIQNIYVRFPERFSVPEEKEPIEPVDTNTFIVHGRPPRGETKMGDPGVENRPEDLDKMEFLRQELDLAQRMIGHLQADIKEYSQRTIASNQAHFILCVLFFIAVMALVLMTR